jgi:hypothetical protein
MKFHLLASVLLAAAGQSAAFTPATTRGWAVATRTPTMTGSSSSALKMSNSVDEVAKLRALAAAAREDAARLSKELSKEEPSAAKIAVPKSTKSTKTPEQVKAAISAIDFTAPAETQIAALDALRTDGSVSLYKCAAGVGDLRSFSVSLKMLESRCALTAESLGVGVEEVSLDDFKYATLYVTGGCSVAGVAALVFLPENVGATVCYAAAIIPILFLAVGSSAPAAIANVIVALKSKDDDEVSKKDRVCRHEAAHFLCGYMCGLPIANYATTDENVPRVEFHTTSTGSDATTQQQELTEDEVNALTVVAMSGAVAEAMEFGKAGGANSDLMELERVFRRSAKFLGAENQQDLTRWGALTAHRLLTGNKDKLNQLIKAFDAQKSVAECIAILEQ